MKIRSLLFVAALCCSLPLHAEGEPGEVEFNALLRSGKFITTTEEETKALDRATPSETIAFEDRREQRLSAAALQLWRECPGHPRRLEALKFFLARNPHFFKAYPKELDAIFERDPAGFMRGFPRDVAARAQWLDEGWRMVQEVLVSPEFSRTDRESVEFALFGRDFRIAAEQYRVEFHLGNASAGAAAKVSYWAPFVPRFDAHAIKYADMPILSARSLDYLGALKGWSAVAAAAGWRHLMETPGATDMAGVLADRAGIVALRETGARQLTIFEVDDGTHPVEMRFTAIDGREVDLRQLRGKVVMVDFWATWCEGCVAALPAVKALYEKHRQRGFEVIGVSFDTADQKSEVLEVLRKNGVTWPQRFEGKGFGTDEYRLTYGMSGLPTTYLLDKSGKLVHLNARLQQLDSLIDYYLNQ